MRQPTAEHLLAELMAHSLMAHTSALLLPEHDSLKCTGVGMEEQYKLGATLPLFPMLVSSVQTMGQSNSIGFTKGSAGTHTQSPATDVRTAKAVVKIAAMEHSNEEITLAVV